MLWRRTEGALGADHSACRGEQHGENIVSRASAGSLGYRTSPTVSGFYSVSLRPWQFRRDRSPPRRTRQPSDAVQGGVLGGTAADEAATQRRAGYRIPVRCSFWPGGYRTRAEGPSPRICRQLGGGVHSGQRDGCVRAFLNPQRAVGDSPSRNRRSLERPVSAVGCPAAPATPYGFPDAESLGRARFGRRARTLRAAERHDETANEG